MRTPVILALHLHLASVAPDVPHAGPARAGQTAGPWSRIDKLVCPQKVSLECTVANGRIIPEYTWRATDHECSVLDPDDALEISLEGDSLRHLKVGGRASLRKSSAAGGGLTLTWEDERGPTVARLTRLKESRRQGRHRADHHERGHVPVRGGSRLHHDELSPIPVRMLPRVREG